MRKTKAYRGEIEIGKYKITHLRKAKDKSIDACFLIAPTDETIWNSVEKLPWFVDKVWRTAEEIRFYISGIKDIDEILASEWGLASKEKLAEQFTDEVTMEKFQTFTLFIISRLSRILRLPISNIKFSEEFVKSSPFFDEKEVEEEIEFYKRASETPA